MGYKKKSASGSFPGAEILLGLASASFGGDAYRTLQTVRHKTSS